MPAMSKTIVRMWNRDGYHRDVLLMDSEQVRTHEDRVDRGLCRAEPFGVSMCIDPAKFPEAVCFEIIVVEYRR